MPKGGIELKGPGLKMLRALERRIGAIASVKREIAATQSEEAVDLIKQGFIEETDPYSQPWKKRARETKKTRGKKVLSGETSHLKDGWNVKEFSSEGFRVQASVEYALYHQKPKKKNGKFKRPRRRMVPNDGVGFPSKWQRPLNDAAAEAITEFLTGK